MGGWIALAAVLILGPRLGRYSKDGRLNAFPPSNIPFLALGSWILTVGWFGFNVMSAQSLEGYLRPCGSELIDGYGGRYSGFIGYR